MSADKTTPVTIGAAITGAVTAVLALLVAFGVTLTDEQQAAILGFVSAALILASLLWQRWGIGKNKVVESTPDGKTVVAGEANELPTGEVIRDNLEPRRAL